MKTYELIFNSVTNDPAKAHFKVSLVKDPAVELTLVKFSKEDSEKPVFFANEEKRVIYAVAMRPNKLIFRRSIAGSGEPGYVYYTPETIEAFQQNYFKKNGNSATNINHADSDTDGIYPFESWIVRDDGSYTKETIGLETMKGDLVMAFKIENEDVWNECKNGNLDGLSIEAFFGYKESMFNFNTEKNTMKWKDFWKTVFGAEPTEIAPGFWAKDKEVGTVVVDKDGAAAANAEFEIDGTKYKTDADGKILAAAEEKQEGDEMTLEQAKEKIATLEKELAEEKEKNSKTEADKVKAETDLTAMKAEKETAETSLTKMTSDLKAEKEAFEKFKKENTPAKPIDNNPPKDDTDYSKFTADQYHALGNHERMKFNRDYPEVAAKFK